MVWINSIIVMGLVTLSLSITWNNSYIYWSHHLNCWMSHACSSFFLFSYTTLRRGNISLVLLCFKTLSFFWSRFTWINYKSEECKGGTRVESQVVQTGDQIINPHEVKSKGAYMRMEVKHARPAMAWQLWVLWSRAGVIPILGRWG